MGKQSRRYQSRKNPLHLETFERRNLLSGIHPLLNPFSAHGGTSFNFATLPQTLDHGHAKEIPALGPTLKALLQIESVVIKGAAKQGLVSDFLGLLNDRPGHADKGEGKHSNDHDQPDKAPGGPDAPSSHGQDRSDKASHS